MNLEDKTVLITGASGGIGHALCKRFRDGGSRVYAMYGSTLRDPLQGVSYLEADIINAAQIQQALSHVEAPVHILINNAGIVRRGSLLGTTDEDFAAMFAINVQGSWMTLKYAHEKLAETATIVQVSSSLGSDPEGLQNSAVYALTKQTTRDLATMVASFFPSFSVKTVFPGPINTPMLFRERNPASMAKLRELAIDPNALAEDIEILIQSDTTQLLYDAVNNKHYLE